MRFIRRWRRARAIRRVAREMLVARRSGHGLYVQEWALAPGLHELESTAEALLSWCRQTIGQCRRPWGIDHFDLTLARSRPGAATPVIGRFRELRPIDLYPGAALFAALLEFLRADLSQTDLPTAGIRVAAALFSWGDAADAALPAAS